MRRVCSTPADVLDLTKLPAAVAGARGFEAACDAKFPQGTRSGRELIIPGQFRASGYFTMDFVWCCSWLPWRWWERRPWRLDPVLVEEIEAVLKLNPSLRVSAPSPKLELEFSELNPQPLPPGRSQAKRQSVGSQDLNPTTLQAIREQLLKLLLTVPEFERFCLWPWCPWYPWLDCDPDIIFKVTQSCGGLTNTMVNENVWQARQDIPTNLSVTLIADSAIEPVWDGGAMMLSIPNASALFPASCAYDLILTVTKRNIVDCSDVYQETLYYSFTVLLQP
jgi:hypothetical protein